MTSARTSGRRSRRRTVPFLSASRSASKSRAARSDNRKRKYELYRSEGVGESVERFDDVSGANHPVVYDVRAEPTSVSERLQYAVPSDALQMATRFTQSIPSTDGVTDPEPPSDEMVECNVTGLDVSSVLSRCEFDSRFAFDCRQGLLLDQREVVPIAAFLVRLPLHEGSRLDLAKVAITPESLSGDRFDAGLFFHLRFGFGCDENPFDGATPGHVCYARLAQYKHSVVDVVEEVTRRNETTAGSRWRCRRENRLQWSASCGFSSVP